VHLKLPYDMVLRGRALFIADGERHQILRYDLAQRRLSVFAGTGATGTSGDGGPALKARLTEPSEVVFDPAGNLYFSDVNQGRVRRIDRRGRITTVARLRTPAGVSVDPAGRYLAIASIQDGVYRMPLPAGPLERLAPAVKSAHDVTYDADGNLYIGPPPGRARRIDAATGAISTPFAVDGFKIVAGRDGTFYLLAGDPRGGRITQVDASGKVVRRIGTGVGFLPSDVEPVSGGILISQAQPFPAIVRLADGGSTRTVVVR
jgi:SMP-30/Gluconolactonase/LRE-like region